MNKISLLDFLLLPKSLYRKFTDKVPTLYIGIFFVGAYDIVMSLVKDYKLYFMGKSYSVLVHNIALLLTFIILIGLLDVIAFSFPQFDLFKFFRKKANVINNSSMLIKLMKVYIVSHLLILPTDAAALYIENYTTYGSNTAVAWIIALYAAIIVPVWFSAIISRGINVLYDFEQQFKSLVFIVVFTWNFLLGLALSYLIGQILQFLIK